MSYALGMDLGTSYTAAAVARSGRAEVVALGYRATSVPTVVFLGDDGHFLIGDAAERRAATSPDRVAREFKRRVGDTTPLFLGGTPLAVDRCLAEVLRWVVATVSETEGVAPAAVTVTHPANWGEFKRDVLREALRLADLPEARLLVEPVAAATWYAQAERMAPGRVVAVYDLGGGTFDAAVLRRTADGFFEMLGRSEGIERLGGIDIDHAVLGHVVRALGDPPSLADSDDPAALAGLAQLRSACIEAKEALSSETSVTIPVWLPGLQHQVLLRRTELEELVGPLLEPTVDALGRVVASAGLHPSDLDAVLLVGGSSRVPMITRQVSAGLGRPVVVDAHPKHPVALGAALHASRHLAAVPVPPPAVVSPMPPPAPPPSWPGAPPRPLGPPPPPAVSPGTGGSRVLVASAAIVVFALVASLVAFRTLRDTGSSDDSNSQGTPAADSSEDSTLFGNEGASQDSGDGPNLLWQADVGEALTGDVIAVDDQRVYVLDDQADLTAYDVTNGNQAWKVDLGEEAGGTQPVLAGGMLLTAVSNPEAIYALDPASGATVWKTDAYWFDPVVVGDLIFGHSGSTITALNLSDGAVAWENEIELWNWATPVLVGDVVVTGTTDGEVAGINPATGDVLWTQNLERGSISVWALAPMGDAVVAVDDDSFVNAFDAASGQPLWVKELNASEFEAPVLVGELLAVPTDQELIFVDPASGEKVRGTGAAAPTIDAAPGETQAVLAGSVIALQALDLEGRQLWSIDLPIDAIELTVGPTALVASDYEGKVAVFAFPG
ncbi:MAG TPA: hsp70 family protein [Acidimicrobiales bacterium]|jgi:outer membrane protein assembly factor BamB/actin-like ATPase involved in cell morphogenesis